MSAFLVTVPDGAASGQTIQITTPDGQMMTTTVPAGVGVGQQFQVNMAPTAGAMTREVDPALAELAASTVGYWKGSGFAAPCCRIDSSYTIHPLNANNQYVLEGAWCLYMCGWCPLAHFMHKGTRDASGQSLTDYSRNDMKDEHDPAGAKTELVGSLTRFDASKKTAAYDLRGTNPRGQVNGTCILDGKAMTETLKRDGVFGPFSMTHKFVKNYRIDS